MSAFDTAKTHNYELEMITNCAMMLSNCYFD